MFKNTKAFSGFSVDDLSKAKAFYGETLGLEVEESDNGLMLHIAGGGSVFIYAKPSHQPATFTILNFPVGNIDQAVDELITKGVTFEQYQSELKTDEKGIYHGVAKGMGPNIAWFRDPAGNILSVMEEKQA